MKKTKKVVFTKAQILSASEYLEYFNVINALLEDDKTYTKQEVNAIIGDYLKREVK